MCIESKTTCPLKIDPAKSGSLLERRGAWHANGRVNREVSGKGKAREPSTMPAKGQAIVEYVLILVVVVAIAAILVRGLVRRDENEPGIIIKVWNQTLETIGADLSD
ncbi:MAG: hypothetical protein COT74_06130 [Bdellovibrionales bacterium CG10_big_fil_rev_8_21_14_0_10_45_34]|nr:MAG: hypothetical protein COT74_06130 [Bdellovibrionales bacterium CG10_big_fil_rev_8_21_14_0_10_45_34]